MIYKQASELAAGIIVPDAFQEPDFVKTDFEEFKRKIREDYKKNKVFNTALARKLLEDIIFAGKVKLKFPLDKKNVNDALNQMYAKFDDAEFPWRYLLFTRVGFFLSSFMPSSFSTDSLTLPDKFKPKKQAILDQYNKDKEKSPDAALIKADKAFTSLAKEVLEYFREHHDMYPVVDLIDSGAKGGVGDIRKLLVSIGLSINAAGDVNDVITRSHTEGLTQTQFFNYSSQAMVSQYKKSVETAVPGYLIRKLNTLMSGVILSKDIDCGTKQYLKLKVTVDILSSLDGKMYQAGTGLKQINSSADDHLVGKTIKIRSALYCKSEDGICATCYNPKFIKSLDMQSGAKIGLLASTSQANMLTSLTLKAAHTGLSLNAEEIDLNQDIFEYSE